MSRRFGSLINTFNNLFVYNTFKFRIKQNCITRTKYFFFKCEDTLDVLIYILTSDQLLSIYIWIYENIYIYLKGPHYLTIIYFDNFDNLYILSLNLKFDILDMHDVYDAYIMSIKGKKK